jgi:hypothetical protein
MDFIRPIGAERDVDPLARVERAHDEREGRERQPPEPREERPGRTPGSRPPADAPDGAPDGPFEGEDGRLHIDTRA